MQTVRIQAPAKVAKGEVFEVKTLVMHPMESGFRRDNHGNPIPRRILNKVVATYDATPIFEADWFTPVAATPFLAFTVRAETSGAIRVVWHDDDGSSVFIEHEVEVV
jgi:sulfur-oxidizing protein SoxZ